MSLTVKWIVKDNGVERIRLFAVHDIRLAYPETRDGKFPPNTTLGPHPITQTSALLDDGSEGGRMLSEGMVYVMNAEGKTVGRYVLEEDFEKQKLYR